MSQDLSILNLVLHATLVVQVVMVGLLAVSVVSWSMIFGKVFGLQKVRTLNESFEREFWSGKNLAELNQAAGAKHTSAPMERIFASGMREFLKLRERRLDAVAQLDGARRAMRASFQRELDGRARRHSGFAAVVAVLHHRERDGPFGVALADDVAVELGDDLPGGQAAHDSSSTVMCSFV